MSGSRNGFRIGLIIIALLLVAVCCLYLFTNDHTQKIYEKFSNVAIKKFREVARKINAKTPIASMKMGEDQVTKTFEKSLEFPKSMKVSRQRDSGRNAFLRATTCADSTKKDDARYIAEIKEYSMVEFVDKPNWKCPKMVKVGTEKKDGGWHACVTPPFDFKKPCIALSFGIRWNWFFDDDLVKNYGCQVFAFDPSMKTKNFKRGRNINFINIGIGGKDTARDRRGWPIYTLKTILRMINLTEATIDILKMDIECDEWKALPVMVADGSLTNVKQIVFEPHFFQRGQENINIAMNMFKRLEKIGFGQYHARKNIFTHQTSFYESHRCCYELGYINTKYLK